MIAVNEAVVVEGKYDKIKLSALIDGLIIETNGFQIYKNPEKMNLLRRLAKERGLLILTDSDAAGFQIRHYLTGAIGPQYIKQAYIPDIYGKERRKEKASSEGQLGVEGLPLKVLREALARAGVLYEEKRCVAERRIEKTDLFEAGLIGREGSAERRRALLRQLNLPEHMNTSTMAKVLNSIMDYEAFQQAVRELYAFPLPDL